MLRNDLGLTTTPFVSKYKSRLAPRDDNHKVLVNGFVPRYKSRLPMNLWQGQDRVATMDVEPFKLPSDTDLKHAMSTDINLVGLLTNEELFDGSSYARAAQPQYVKTWKEQNGLGEESTAAQYSEAIYRFVTFPKEHPDFIDKKEVMSIIGTKHVLSGWSRGYFKMENGEVVQVKT